MHRARTAGQECRQNLFVFSGGFLIQKRLRRILQLSGYDIRIGLPAKNDKVGVWGASPTSDRGRRVATRRGATLLRIEDAFLRSLFPGRTGTPPIGLFLDQTGLHFDGSQPSDLENILRRDPLDDTALLNRARSAIERIKEAHLTKYSAVDPELPVSDPGYVLVIDQAKDDASVRASHADRSTFIDMLAAANIENPGAEIVIKTHPETQAGVRVGYYRQEDLNHRTTFCEVPISPWTLLDNARAVYTVSSQFGFEAIMAGHKPRIFGQPFYASWGLTDDEIPVMRRDRMLSRTQLFAAAMMLYPAWYDPRRDQLCEIEDVIDTLEAEARSWREDRHGYTATNIRLWKRPHIQKFFGRHQRVRFAKTHDLATGNSEGEHRSMTWGMTSAPENTIRIEDGFLRSRGLGANLTPPYSLVRDTRGLYYDPTSPNQLEQIISNRSPLGDGQRLRAQNLISSLISGNLSKYNTGDEPLPDLPTGHRILVPGQVEDDASIQLGCTEICTNLALLQTTRENNPDAVIIYKPHPDVVAGLRQGNLETEAIMRYADVILPDCTPAAILAKVDEVWTMTSLMGFEALLRGLKVTCAGIPFYAGWGLTVDRAPTPVRRVARVSLEGLVHAALIDYPRYIDPVTREPCSVELVVERLITGQVPVAGPLNRSLSKLQGLFSTHSWLWRR